MTKKKTKKGGQKIAPPTPAAEQQKEKEDELDMLEDIKRDEDLYISESDVTNISNFIRTTNKSFNSLGNNVVEKFNNRCSLAILHALIALFDLDSEDREDVIRRLNIIYIVWRLPDLEQELRLKPTKTMQDVYTHPFATFLFYAEQLEKHRIEATLARIIVTNNVGVVEKLTAPDFIQKATSLDLHKVDREAFEKWSEMNTDHWPEITEEMVSLSKAMRELGCERKDHEAGMAEAFYPLVHNPPTMLPPRMAPLPQEDPTIKKYREEKDPKNEEAIEVIYSVTVGNDMQTKLQDAFKDLTKTVDDYQTKINKGMTAAELEEANREITLDGVMSDSSDSSLDESDSDSDSETEAEVKFRQMTEHKDLELNDKTIEGCIQRILDGTTLTTGKLEYAMHFARKAVLTHPQFVRLLDAAKENENVIRWCKTNPKFAAEFMTRHALSDTHNVQRLFRRYVDLTEANSTLLASFEFVVKISIEFKERSRFENDCRERIMQFIRSSLKAVEDAKHPSARSVRLVSMLIMRLLRAVIISADEIATFVKPFCLKYSDNRDCTSLYQLISDIQAGKNPVDEVTSTSTTTTGSPSMMRTTTTTTSVNTNATSTTTTTTVVRQCGPAVIKQTSKKVVLSAPQCFTGATFQETARKALGAFTAALRNSSPSKFQSSSTSSDRHHHHHGTTSTATSSSSTTTTIIQVIDGEEEILSDDDDDGSAEETPLNEKNYLGSMKDFDRKDDDDDDAPPPNIEFSGPVTAL